MCIKLLLQTHKQCPSYLMSRAPEILSCFTMLPLWSLTHSRLGPCPGQCGAAPLCGTCSRCRTNPGCHQVLHVPHAGLHLCHAGLHAGLHHGLHAGQLLHLAGPSPVSCLENKHMILFHLFCYQSNYSTHKHNNIKSTT